MKFRPDLKPLILAALMALPCTAFGQETVAPTTNEPPATNASSASTPPAPADNPPNPDAQTKQTEHSCAEQSVLDSWIDRLHSNLFRLTCSTASWFDGLFADRRSDYDYRASSGSVTAGGVWSQRNGLEKVLRFHAHLYLPQISDRFHAFVGRVDRNEYISESKTDIYGLPSAFGHNLEDSTLLGLGYSEPLQKRGSFDVGTGVHLQFPLDPYVKGSYRYARPIGERDLMRLQETLFWENINGVGVTSRVDWDHVISEHNLLRWSGAGTYTQERDSRLWDTSVTLYHVLSLAKQRALASQVFASGGIDSPVVERDYGLTLIYRESVWRQWLIVEVRAGVDWPHLPQADETHANFNTGLAFEMSFGKK